MTLRGDDRAVTVQVGAILLFGFLVVAASAYQMTVVPAANEEAEFRHGERVRADLLSLHGAVDAAAAGDARSSQVELGTGYPQRTLFVNPPPVTGSLRSVDAGAVSVRNAVAVGDPETAEYWNGDRRRFETDRLRYRAGYNVRSDAPATVVEHGVVVETFENGAELPRTEQTLVRSRSIDLVGLAAGVSESGVGTRSVTPRAASPATETVAVRNETRPVVVEFDTALAGDTWEALLADQTVAEGGHVTAVEASDGRVRVELEANVTYRLRMAKVAVGTDADTSAAYLTTVDGSTARVAAAGDEITVEARDRFNNPVAGATVEVEDGAEIVESERTLTDAEGRATFAYDGDGAGPLRVRLAGGTANHEAVTLTVRRTQPP